MAVDDKAGADCRKSDWPLLWAKTDQGNGDSLYHPLLYHMLDVAAVAGLVWDHHLSAGLRKRLEWGLGLADARTLVVFVTGAHDIGKASPGFQKKAPGLRECSELPFSNNDRDFPHGFISARILNELLGHCSASALLGQIVGGHHGVFPRSAELQMGRDTLGNEDWKTARDRVLNKFAKVLGFDLKQVCQSRTQVSDPFVVPVLAGFVSVVDWIGSNQDFFPCGAKCAEPITVSAEEYWAKAQVQAREALETLGWSPSVTFVKEARFDGVFRGFTANALQRTATDLAARLTSPYLMIVEAPMGCGKTEAALYAADVAMCRGFARGMYVAMPTQATGDAMFKRVLDNYLRQRGHQGKLNLQLVHGNALLAQMPKEPEEGEIPEFKPKDIGEEDGDLEAQSWFTAKKRPLLAPFGVGTIDQSLLSVLQTKHWFVRLLGLAGKAVIFDEVHAYDAYMSTILERLLHWLAELDCTVILLSATLPEAKRRVLANAYSGRDDAQYKRYPRITLAKSRHYLSGRADEAPVCKEIPTGESRTVHLQFHKTDLVSLTGTVAQKLEHGGCAAVICNTVNRSMEVYKHLRDNLKETACLLFHARTLQMWRRQREEEILRKFGKRDPQDKDEQGRFVNPDRPFRAVLVATQVIEQSLDLDFDLMVSEIAPIDLLLQRSGRLHRHPRKRPQGLEAPEFFVLCDAEIEGPPPESFGNSIEYVYDRYILLRTWLALREQHKIEVPSQIQSLVEAVYGPGSIRPDDHWSNSLAGALAAFEVDTDDSIGHARQLIIRQPDKPEELIERLNRELDDDDDPATDIKVRAATREGEPSIRAVFLLDGEAAPTSIGINETRWLLDRSASISHKPLFSKLLALKVPAAWQNNAHLRHCRLVEVGKTKDIKVDVNQDLGVVTL